MFKVKISENKFYKKLKAFFKYLNLLNLLIFSNASMIEIRIYYPFQHTAYDVSAK